MEEEQKKENWLDAMIERQALPEEVRDGTTGEFCKKWGIPQSTYYYHYSKEENQKKIINLSIRNAKKHCPEVLENLGERAKKEDRAAELYLKFILQLAEKTDLTSMGEKINFCWNENNNHTVSTKSVGKGISPESKTVEDTSTPPESGQDNSVPEPSPEGRADNTPE